MDDQEREKILRQVRLNLRHPYRAFVESGVTFLLLAAFMVILGMLGLWQWRMIAPAIDDTTEPLWTGMGLGILGGMLVWWGGVCLADVVRNLFHGLRGGHRTERLLFDMHQELLAWRERQPGATALQGRDGKASSAPEARACPPEPGERHPH